MLRDFEPESYRDWLLIPWWLLRLLFAWLWWQAWPLVQLVRGRWRTKSAMSYSYGRHDDPTPVMCPRCLWAGPRRWLVHTYTAVGMDDVEPVDECPRCGQEL